MQSVQPITVCSCRTVTSNKCHRSFDVDDDDIVGVSPWQRTRFGRCHIVAAPHAVVNVRTDSICSVAPVVFCVCVCARRTQANRAVKVRSIRASLGVCAARHTLMIATGLSNQSRVTVVKCGQSLIGYTQKNAYSSACVQGFFLLLSLLSVVF